MCRREREREREWVCSLLYFFSQKSVESIVATLKVLMESQIEELKILQTILLLVTSMNIVRGRSLSKVG